MTAIAYKDGILAVDSQCTWGTLKTQTKKYYVVNVYNIGDCVVALCGNVHAAEHIVKWVSDNENGRDTPFEGLTSNTRYGFAITEDLIVYPIYGNGYVGLPDENAFVSEGCAYEFLHGAMAAGATAQRAVELAVDNCDGCGFPVMAIDVKGMILDARHKQNGAPF